MKGAATSSGAAPSRDRLTALRTRGALRNFRAPVVVPEAVVRLAGWLAAGWVRCAVGSPPPTGSCGHDGFVRCNCASSPPRW